MNETRWNPIRAFLITVLVGLGLLVTLVLVTAVVSPSAGAAGGCGGG
jgi:hypothetical protein